jgi:hypothetical protein
MLWLPGVAEHALLAYRACEIRFGGLIVTGTEIIATAGCVVTDRGLKQVATNLNQIRHGVFTRA